MTKIKGVYKNGGWLAYCCGARVSRITPRVRVGHPGKGIRVFLDKVGKEIDTGKVCVSHVETSAGPITVTVKYDH